jgi:hypothetical protein
MLLFAVYVNVMVVCSLKNNTQIKDVASFRTEKKIYKKFLRVACKRFIRLEE